MKRFFSVFLIVFILNLICVSSFAATSTDLVENYINTYFGTMDGIAYKGITISKNDLVVNAIFNNGDFTNNANLLSTEDLTVNSNYMSVINTYLNPSTASYYYYTLIPYYVNYDKALTTRFYDIKYYLIFSNAELLLKCNTVSPTYINTSPPIIRLYTFPLGSSAPSEYTKFDITLRVYTGSYEGASSGDYKININSSSTDNSYLSLSKLVDIYNSTTHDRRILADMSSFSRNTYNDDFFTNYQTLIVSNLKYIKTLDDTDYDISNLSTFKLVISKDKDGNIPDTTPLPAPPSNDYNYTEYYYVDNTNTGINNNSNKIVNYNGTNYYETYTFTGGFTNYFRDNISSSAELYYSVILDGIDNAIKYRVPVSTPYEGGFVYFNFNENLARQLNSNKCYIVFEYKTTFNNDYEGKAIFEFDLPCLPSQSLPVSNSYNFYDDNAPPVVDDVMIHTDINVDNGTYNPNNNLWESQSYIENAADFDPLSYDWVDYFTNIFSFFRIAFAWLPSEIINIVSTGFFILMGVMIYKFFRG